MSKFARYGVAFLALVACALSTFAASQSGAHVWYLGAFGFALMGIGSTRFPALAEITDQSHVRVRVWWAPAVLSLGMLLWVAVLVARFVRLAAA